MSLKNHLLLAGFLFILVVAALGLILARDPAHTERGIAQERLDTASAAVSPQHSVGQTFVSRQANLKGVELLLVVYDPGYQVAPEAVVTLRLERLDQPMMPLVVETSAVALQHNQHLSFAWPPLADSREATYQLTVRANGNYPLGFWYATQEAYAEGERWEDGVPQVGDLWFITSYDYRLAEALGDLVRLTASFSQFIPALLLLLGLPGLALGLGLLAGGRAPEVWREDGALRSALVVALSVAFWPLLLLWSSALGVSLAGGRVWGVVAALGLATAWGLARWWRSRPRNATPPAGAPSRDRLPDLALAIILLGTLGARLLQVRELLVPAYVDSVHHTLITRLIAEGGMIPASFRPYMPVDDFHYHFGFHASAAAFSWLSGLPPDQAILVLGQVLNAAASLTVYALVVGLSRNRWAGVMAALIVGLVSNMPAYFVSWGRYTHLTGLVLLPLVCLGLVWILEQGGRRGVGVWLAGMVLAAGLALTHYRLAIFFALFCLCYAPLALWRARRERHGGRGVIGRGAFLAGLAGLAILPWALRFALRVLPSVGATYDGWEAVPGYNTFPWGFFSSGYTRQLVYLAGAGAVWALLRRKGEVIVLIPWVGLWFVVANLRWLGLPDVWLVHNHAVVISTWLPEGLLGGWLLGDLALLAARGLAKLRAGLSAQRLVSVAMLALAVVMTAWGMWDSVDVINPSTVMVSANDMNAIVWVAEHTPPQARFLVNTQRMNGELRAGTDAGWWLTALTGRATTLPSMLYASGGRDYHARVDQLSRAVEEAETLDDAALLALLREEGITHVFVGWRGGKLVPTALDASAHYRQVYESGPARVYEIIP
jgi:hypothetical protein